MSMHQNIAISAATLSIFALCGVLLVALTERQTRHTIAENQRTALLQALSEVVRPQRYDNQLAADTRQVTAPEALGTSEPITVYRARNKSQPVAVAMQVIAPDGYSGEIELLVGINYDGTLSGVRVTRHRETPGLGDAIEMTRSPWLTGFDAKSLDNPGDSGWRVKKDGGEFDQFTGATITPRAIVGAVHRALHYFQDHKALLFATPKVQAGAKLHGGRR